MHMGSNKETEYQIAEMPCVRHGVILKRVKKDAAAKVKAVTQMQIKTKNRLRSSNGCCQVPGCSYITCMKENSYSTKQTKSR